MIVKSNRKQPVKTPFLGDALKPIGAAVLEFDFLTWLRSRSHRPRDQHFIRARSDGLRPHFREMFR